MIRPKFKVHLFKKSSTQDNVWSSSFEDISDSVAINESSGIETRKDSFSFQIMNRKLKGDLDYSSKLGLKQPDLNRFTIRDNIKIFMWNGEKPNDLNDALIIDGLVTELNQKTDENLNNVQIKGANRSEVLLSNMVPTAVGSPNLLSPPEIIQNIVSRINKFDPQKKLLAVLDNATMYGADNQGNLINLGSGLLQSTHADDTAFDKISYSQNWKNAYEQVEELSGPKYTDEVGSFPREGKYMFDIVNINTITPEGESLTFNALRWRSKNTDITGKISEKASGSDSFSTSTVSLGTFDVVNAAIVSGGNNLRGGGILRVVYNQSSMGRLGAKWKFIPMNKTFNTIYNREKPYITDADGDRFPDSYPYTFTTISEATVDGVNPAGAVDDDKEFNGVLVDETGSEIKRLGDDIVKLLGDARYKASFELRYGTNIYNNGNLYSLEIPSFGWDNTATNPAKVLRLVNHINKFDNNGWTTTLKYEEDEKIVSDVVNT